MPEVGLVVFARVALVVARAVLLPYRAPRSKHTFTQPQLLAICCLMRYEDWTYREAEVRLREHRELRRALGLRRVPDYSTLCRFVARLEPAAASSLRCYQRDGRYYLPAEDVEEGRHGHHHDRDDND